MPPVEVNEAERQRDIQGRQLVGRASPFSRLEGYHEVNKASGPFLLEGLHNILAENLLHQPLERIVNTLKNKRKQEKCAYLSNRELNLLTDPYGPPVALNSSLSWPSLLVIS